MNFKCFVLAIYESQTKLENEYDQNKLKFHKILVLAPFVSTGAQHLEKGDETEVQNDKFMDYFENLRNDPGSSQMTPGRFRELS